jgi:hypothetical protein
MHSCTASPYFLFLGLECSQIHFFEQLQSFALPCGQEIKFHAYSYTRMIIFFMFLILRILINGMKKNIQNNNFTNHLRI